jgi:hypothetical protein
MVLQAQQWYRLPARKVAPTSALSATQRFASPTLVEQKFDIIEVAVAGPAPQQAQRRRF